MSTGLPRRPVILDTDLGSDVDDALALAVLLGSPEVDLLGAVTVYGDVQLRARLTAGFARLAGRDLTVLAGTADPLSGRAVWVSGDEGRHFPGLDPTPVDTDGVGWMLAQARRYPGELEILAIGPLTNLARALRADPSFARSVRRVWLMGGSYENDGDTTTDDASPEHNFTSDAVAADEVLRSGMPITALGVDLTRRLRLLEPQIAALGPMGALGAQLERETRAWAAYWDEDHDVPHDATAAVAMLRPDLFTDRRARVSVIPHGVTAGRVLVQPASSRSGSVITVVTGLDAPAVTDQILGRIRAASQGEPCAT